MVEDNGETVRAVAWSELFPWLSLARVFRLAISFRVLLLAAMGLATMAVGWAFFGWIFGGPGHESTVEWMGADRGCPWTSITAAVSDPRILPAVPGPLKGDRAAGGPVEPLSHTWSLLSRPVITIFSPETSLTGLACAILVGLWTLGVWAFFGGAICRLVSVQLACDERISWGAAIRFASRKWLAFFAAPLFPLIGVVLAALPIFLLGVLLRSDVGILLLAILWPGFLILGLLMALLLLGLIFGWPLMWATISTEGTDSFDALSRSYAYSFQRPLHYLFYAIVAGSLGLLGWVLVSKFAAGIVWLVYWAASWGAGGSRIDSILSNSADLGSIGRAGKGLIDFWVGCVKLLAVSYIFSYFWTASTAIYYLLCRNVDATETDEVFLEEDEQTFGLPPLKVDNAGVPVVDEPTGSGEKTPDEE